MEATDETHATQRLVRTSRTAHSSQGQQRAVQLPAHDRADAAVRRHTQRDRVARIRRTRPAHPRLRKGVRLQPLPASPVRPRLHRHRQQRAEDESRHCTRRDLNTTSRRDTSRPAHIRVSGRAVLLILKDPF